ncbi:MAG: bifunctional diaminohydroxyphosphoribosylaminopyrimidine deaminase/5-amino-6-(5-phosphoribosylamino)uracil reductase RibD [Acidobacteriota bacterium]
MVTGSDQLFMERALFLAERGRGRTTPNPLVGAVVVSDAGIVVGQGAHLVAGGPHAEVVALDAAGARARGATLYCTLEPCSHTGRTGPCTVRIAAAGIRRVVAAVRDPNPQVSGQGFAYLRERGVGVDEGLCEQAARVQNRPFLTWITKGRPFVILKAATSADGFVGLVDKAVKLTGPEADRFFHRQRAAVDAIAVGSGTVLVDDPFLTARGAFRHRPLTRVVFDWRGRVPRSARLFSTLAAGPVIMMVSAHVVLAAQAHFNELTQRGVIVQGLEQHDIAAALKVLASRETTSLLVEGGPLLHTAFADAGLVDCVQWVVTSRVLGTGVRMAPVIGAAPPLTSCDRRTLKLGGDLLIEFDVHGTDRNYRTH